MFQKIRLRLTLLCASITILILLVMSCGWLYVSEKNLRSSSFISFQNDMNTLLGNMEQQTVISHEWLRKMENNGKYQIWILDNGVPFLYNEQGRDAGELFRQAWARYESLAAADTDTYTSETQIEFFFSPEGTDASYYAAGAVLKRSQGELEVLVLTSLASLENQIQTQRLLFLTLDLTGAAALILFSWYFTKRLLLPLEESQKRQARFVASASHELRTPLSVILSCISASRKAAPKERENFLEAAETEGRRMSGLIEDMLLLSRADTQSWTIQKEAAEADTLLLETYEAFLPLARERKLKLEIRLPEDSLPPCLCDRERIRQVLMILLDNALCYTPSGGMIRLSLAYTQGLFSFSVADNGPGIPPEQRKYIFERFYRADAARSGREHFGLGLCIAAEIIKAHRGRLTVSETPGGGSTFVIQL